MSLRMRLFGGCHEFTAHPQSKDSRVTYGCPVIQILMEAKTAEFLTENEVLFDHPLFPRGQRMTLYEGHRHDLMLINLMKAKADKSDKS